MKMSPCCMYRTRAGGAATVSCRLLVSLPGKEPSRYSYRGTLDGECVTQWWDHEGVHESEPRLDLVECLAVLVQEGGPIDPRS